MNDVFSANYSDAYDLLYQDKDYSEECDLIDRIFKDYGDGDISHVLDLGCGTGNHALLLAQRGYQITGIDISKDMLAHARNKAADVPELDSLTLLEGDIRSLELNRRFDGAIMMFAVLGYQQGNADVLSALGSVRRHLSDGGIFIFDIWYGPAVLQQRPSDRFKEIPTPSGKVLRHASGELDTRNHTCTVNYHLWQLDGDNLVSETKESHLMRYFFPLELEGLLEQSGFSLIRLGAFPDFDQDPGDDTWNVLGVAKAVTKS